MEAIIPAPSLTTAPGGQPQTNRAGGDNSFAPSLSHAVSNRKKNDGHSSRKPSLKTASTHTEKIPEEKLQGSDQAEKISAKSDKKEKLSSSLNDITTERPSATPSSEADTDSKTAVTDTTSDSTLLFTGGMKGYLFSLQNDTPLSDPQKTIPSLSDGLSFGKQGSKNLPQNLADSGKDALTSEQLKNPLSSDTVTPRIIESPTGLLTLGKQDGLNILQNTYGLQSNSQGADTNTVFPILFQDQSAASLNSGKNPMQICEGKEQNIMIAQQLQKILSENGVKESTIVQQPSPRNQAAGLDSLSGPLFTITDAQARQTTTLSDVTAGSAIASLSKELIPGEKITDKSLSGFENNHPGMLTKADEHDQKITAKFQGKDALLQDSADHRQTIVFNPSSTLDAAGTGQQAGQFSFGSVLTQNLQTAQHTTGTTGSNALPLWTPSQENALINQVMQNFQINSTSPASKLVLKLHPEELGELKIDIQMKDGAIKANIFTQTEQVQQVLEKYIPKLKTLMEQQGLTVDDIRVTNTSGNVGDHDLFQKDFSDRHDFSQPGKSTKSTPFTDLTFEKTFFKSSDTLSGVNVTV